MAEPDKFWHAKPYHVRLPCHACGAIGGLLWQTVVNLTRKRTTIYMTCLCGFSSQLTRPTDPEDFIEPGQLGRPDGLTRQQYKTLKELSDFIDQDQDQDQEE